MIHKFEHKFTNRLSTTMTTQQVLLPNNVDVVEKVSMFDMITGKTFELEEYSNAFNATYTSAYPLYGSYQFSSEKFFYDTKKYIYIRFHNPNFNYTHIIIDFKSKIMERNIKCELLLA